MVSHRRRHELCSLRALRAAVSLVEWIATHNTEESIREYGWNVEDLIRSMEDCASHTLAWRATWTRTVPKFWLEVSKVLAAHHRGVAARQKRMTRETIARVPGVGEFLAENPVAGWGFSKIEDEVAEGLVAAARTQPQALFAALIAVIDLLAAIVASVLAVARNVRRRSTAGGRLARLPSVTLTPRLSARPRALRTSAPSLV